MKQYLGFFLFLLMWVTYPATAGRPADLEELESGMLQAWKPRHVAHSTNLDTPTPLTHQIAENVWKGLYFETKANLRFYKSMLKSPSHERLYYFLPLVLLNLGYCLTSNPSTQILGGLCWLGFNTLYVAHTNAQTDIEKEYWLQRISPHE